MKKIIFSIITTSILLFSFAGASSAATIYNVEKGDSLWKIAMNHETSVSNLKNWNNLTSDLIFPDQKLNLAGPTSKKENTENKQSDYKTLTVKATAYTADCTGCSGITATGINLNNDRNAKVIAVDPKVIPLGTKVWVEGYGEAIAGDTGGAIKGHKIDLHVPTTKKALNWGVRTVKVKVYQ
ncbi:3D domain-containing protein [Bacillus niameyensis]|uniref:3D domain-containing protein n=1 Tax=Bacillus niameyensis TaxID=1522308 RepID=UPI00078656AF|nr:3D domain-containing protein [Bacillus niameyensis]